MMSNVSAVPAASSAEALAYFEQALRVKTDCWDVHEALTTGRQDFVLLDVRSHAHYKEGHVPGAINLPHTKIVEPKLGSFPLDALFVVYCAGPHCNGAHKAAIRLARMNRKVKLMMGGVTGWCDEGFVLEK